MAKIERELLQIPMLSEIALVPSTIERELSSLSEKGRKGDGQIHYMANIFMSFSYMIDRHA